MYRLIYQDGDATQTHTFSSGDVFIGRSPEDLRENAIAGTPDEVVEQIGRYAALGAQRVYLQALDVHDLDHLRLLAAEVMPRV